MRAPGSAVARAAQLLAAAPDVTLLAHVDPDADSLGSALALGIALHRRGAAVRVSFATPERMPETLVPLDVLGLVVPPEQVPAAPPVLVACDAAEPARLGTLADRLAASGVSVMLDHHVTNPGFGDVQVLDPDAEATVVLAYDVLRAMDAPLDADVARCLYAGLVTDTSGFRRAGAAAHHMAAELVAAGVDPEPLVRGLMDTHPYAWLAELGAILQAAVLEPDAAGGLGMVRTCVPLEVTARFRQEEVYSVVDLLRTAAEAEVAVLLRQVGGRTWSVSLRSTGRVDVAAAAALLGGGGHRAAAGFTRDGSAEEVLAALRGALPAGPPEALAS
ncbi:phosphoesterase [Pseudonocardia sp. CNS-139]|nr:phosphoesterase [Pseudonocardia sp. CNS-139]